MYAFQTGFSVSQQSVTTISNIGRQVVALYAHKSGSSLASTGDQLLGNEPAIYGIFTNQHFYRVTGFQAATLSQATSRLRALTPRKEPYTALEIAKTITGGAEFSMPDPIARFLIPTAAYGVSPENIIANPEKLAAISKSLAGDITFLAKTYTSHPAVEPRFQDLETSFVAHAANTSRKLLESDELIRQTFAKAFQAYPGNLETLATAAVGSNYLFGIRNNAGIQSEIALIGEIPNISGLNSVVAFDERSVVQRILYHHKDLGLGSWLNPKAECNTDSRLVGIMPVNTRTLVTHAVDLAAKL